MASSAPTIDTSGWIEVSLNNYGVSLRLPPDWETLPPVPSNGHELIRATSGGSLEVIVFKLRSHGLPVTEIAVHTQRALEQRDYVDFDLLDQPFGGSAGARLSFRYGGDERPGRTSWEYFAARGPAVFILGLSSAHPDQDLPMVEALATTFALLPG